LRLSRMHTSKIVFLAVLLVSSISLAGATVSNVGIYAALNNLKFKALNIDLVMNLESFSAVIDMEVSNPTWYEGLYLGSIISTLYYEGENHTVIISPGGPRVGTPFQEIVTRWWDLPPNEEIVNSPLKPYTPIRTQLNFTVTGEPGTRFQEFYENQGKNQEYILWMLESRVYLVVPNFLHSIGLEYRFSLKS